MRTKLVMLLAILVLASCSSGEKSGQNYQTNEVEEQTVYVCTGAKSKRYHTYKNCKGLRRCSRRIIQITKSEAEEKGKTPCRICTK